MPGYTAYVKIAEGFDNACTFCIIPTLRGAQRSRSIEDIVEEAHRLAGRGAVERNFVAQDLTAYGHDLPSKPRLHDLLKAMKDVPVRWLLLYNAYPRDFPDELIEVMASRTNVAKYLDTPLQHISDPVLRRMKRGGTSASVRKLCKKLRDRIPGLVFRTSFIVGFPGETDEQFQELCDFVQEQRFDRVGVFQFSREEGTTSYDGQLPQRTKASRQKKLLGLQRKTSRELQDAMVGKTIDVLVEGVSDETDLLLEGRWMGQAPAIDGKVHVNRGSARVGEIVQCEVEQAGDYDLVAGIVGADGPPTQIGSALAASARLESALPTEQTAAQLPPLRLPRFPILRH